MKGVFTKHPTIKVVYVVSVRNVVTKKQNFIANLTKKKRMNTSKNGKKIIVKDMN